MLCFGTDYLKGAHEKVLEAIIKTNDEALSGYGSDIYSEKAKNKIRGICKKEKANVYFLVGGTQTNAIVINSLLKSYEGVISVDTGHINVHEAGAIEFTGHKVITIPNYDGKMKVEDLIEYLETFHSDATNKHMVYPGMVYISHPTEYGTLYTKSELENISKVCKQYNIPLFMDGARLGYGIMADDTDVDMEVVANTCDVFYIGGTKVGAMFGEAVVFPNGNAPKRYVSIIKNQAGLLAKGRFLGIQFDTLFTDDLYFKVSRHAIEMANILKNGLKEKGYRFKLDSPTNQQFIIMENNKVDQIREKVDCAVWEKYDNDHTILRFVTSWSTKKEEVEELLKLL